MDRTRTNNQDKKPETNELGMGINKRRVALLAKQELPIAERVQTRTVYCRSRTLFLVELVREGALFRRIFFFLSTKG